tara:strand:- start:5055 stop:5258 length:204 start_codon:yes stop_codon:yes gene_type:complete
MLRTLIIHTIIVSGIFGLPLQVGDISPNFTEPICANGAGDFDLYTECNGDINGGSYKVTWLMLFTSW